MKEYSTFANAVNQDDHACISDIFSQDNEINDIGEHLIIHPGVTFVKNFMVKGSGAKRTADIGKKQQIITFSDKSRRNMMITMAKIDEALRFWQDLTFADDVMEGLTVAEAAKFSSLCLKKLKQWMERNGINVFGLWKREWVRRKSGSLKGSYVPHFHLVYTIKDSNEDSYSPTVSRIALKWVEITGTQEKEKALRVALHPKSFRYVESRKQMQKYMSKYLVKNDPISTEESIGRNWGRLGNLEVHNGEVIYVTEDETVFLKRCLRKIVKNPKGYFKVSLNRQATQFFVFIERTTIIRLLEWHRVNHTFEDLPF